MKYFELKPGSFLTERTSTLLEFVSKIEGQQSGIELNNKQANFVALMRESENYLIEDLIFRTRRSFLCIG